jgi:hypothetical protein
MIIFGDASNVVSCTEIPKNNIVPRKRELEYIR